MVTRVLRVAALFLAASRLSALTYTVTNTSDSGAGSLRQAILDANANAGSDIIAFNVSGAGCDGAGLCTITPASALPTLTDAVLIDGYTQSGASPNTNALGGTNAVLKIVVSGAGTPASAGLNLNANDSTIRGLVINAFTVGIQPAGSNDSKIQGCFIGVDAAGQTALPTSWGINAQNGTNLTIGGPAPADRNLLSGNSYGMEVRNFPGSLIQGNLIGTTASGDARLGNIYGIGVALDSGALTIAGNVVSGNGSDINGVGIVVYNEGSSGNPTFLIQGNWIGTDTTGVLDLGNFPLGGIAVGNSNVTVGGPAPGQGNVIAYNRGGVQVYGNSKHSPIRGNSIHSNDGVFAGFTTVGIDLYTDGVTPNDLGDADAGANDRQNFPIITSAISSGGSTTIQGKLNSLANTTFTIDFYANPVCVGRPQGFREGQTYLGASDVTTDGSGNATINVVLPVTIDPGSPVTATATAPDGNTSEFSQRLVLSSTPGGGSAAGGTPITLTGFNFLPGAVVTVGATPATNVVVSTYNQITANTPALGPGTLNGVTVTNTDGTAGTLPNGWIADFLDVTSSNQFYSFVTTLVRNAITVGVGGGNYGVDQPTLRRQMAVFLLKAKYGICYVPPQCTGIFNDVACPSTFADWIEDLANQGITGGCGGNNYCPANPVRRDQMAVFLLKAKYGSSYVPPLCNGDFLDVPCPSTFANWIEQLAAELITGGCGGGNYCPLNNNTRGQMAVFVVKTFDLQ
ncbi:MAG: IPT/TIG domain-containing protein [Thermoanaerobaculia bacterium]